MASSGEREQFPVPQLGMRKDIDELVAGPDSAIDAMNVLVYDSAIRPRPGCSREGFGQDASTWIVLNPVEDFPDHLPGPIFKAGTYLCCFAYIRDISTGLMVQKRLMTSDDGGATWVEDVTVVAYPDSPPARVLEVGTDIWLFCADGSIWVAPSADYPTTPMTWTKIGTMPIPVSVTYSGDPYIYDPWGNITYYEPDDRILFGVYIDKENSLGVRELYLIIDASSVVELVEDTNYFYLDSLIQGFEGGSTFYYAAGAVYAFTAFVFHAPTIPGSPIQGFVLHTSLDCRPIVFDDPGYSLGEATSLLSGGAPGNEGIHTSEFDNTKALIIDQTRIYEHTPGDPLPGDEFFPLDTSRRITQAVAVGFDGTLDGFIFSRYDCLVTKDGGATWDEIAYIPVSRTGYGGFGKSIQLNGTFYYSLLDNQLEYGQLPPNYIAIPPRALLPAVFAGVVAEEIGQVTSIFQSDLDVEEKAVFVGTTKKLLKLNRSSKQWEEVTDPTKRMDGVHGLNPVIFRSFETGGRQYIISTNGEQYPLIYHADLPGGTARFLGQITEGVADPRYNTGNTQGANYSIEGDSAPVARCMAIAAGRLILANLPGIGSAAVDVSDFLDPDRGYGLVQMTILGDTPGGIVSANEISALQVAMYKEDSIFHAVAQTEFLGVAAPFRFELVKAGVSGPCSPMSVANMQTGAHAYLARDGGVYTYDGSAPRDVGRNVRRLIQPYINDNERGKSWGMADPHRKLLWFFFPTKTGALNRGVVMSTDQGYPWPVWPVKFPQGWEMAAGMRAFFLTDRRLGEMQERMDGWGTSRLGDFVSGREEMIMGRLNNTWYTQEWDTINNYTDDGIPIEILLQTGWHPLGGTVDLKTVHELYHVFSPNSDGVTLNVELLGRLLSQRMVTQGTRLLQRAARFSRTSHRLTADRFSIRITGIIDELFKWGGAITSFSRRGPG